MVGTTLSHYKILEPIGSGGMGEVYRARDLRLERDVAIKVLPAGTLAEAKSRQLFREEALALARLNHPNVAGIYELGQHEDQDFLVMELVPGQTLSDRIARGPIPEKDVRRIGKQLADGLAAAHRQGVLHRDIKPGNIRVTPEGRVKILDFGLAKLTHAASGLSGTRTVVSDVVVAGTLPYMAPEQLRGEPTDARSDIYSAGAVLYEAACGQRAFPQKTSPALIGSILGQPPSSLREVNPAISHDLERIVLRCLEKDPSHRYDRAATLATNLKQVAPPGAPAKNRKAPDPRRGTLAGILGGALALAVAAALVLAINVGGIKDRLLGGGPDDQRSLAVLPLANLSGDPGQQFFADGMTDELITRLAQVSAMRVISRSSVMQYRDAKKPLRTIAKELGVRMVVEGSVAQVGGIIRVSAQLIDAFEDRNVWAESYERSARNVLLLEGEVAGAIVNKVEAKLTPDERERITSARPVDTEVHENYLRGLFYMNQFSIESFEKGIECFDRCIEKDPSYAPAYAGLASAYCALSSIHIPATEAMPRARAAAAKALAIDPKLAAAYVPLAYVEAFYDWNWSQGERTFRRAIQLNPNEASAHLFYGQQLMVTGRYRESSQEIERARAIDPLSSYAAAMSLWPLYFERRFPEAAEAASRLSASDPKNASPHSVLGLALSMTGDPKRGADEFQRAYALDPRPNYLAWVGWARARAGDRAGAVEVLQKLRSLSKSSYVQPYNFAIVYASLGEPDSSVAALERGVDLRSEEMLEIRASVAMDPLRKDPRFQRILRKMNLAS